MRATTALRVRLALTASGRDPARKRDAGLYPNNMGIGGSPKTIVIDRLSDAARAQRTFRGTFTRK